MTQIQKDTVEFILFTDNITKTPSPLRKTVREKKMIEETVISCYAFISNSERSF